MVGPNPGLTNRQGGKRILPVHRPLALYLILAEGLSRHMSVGPFPGLAGWDDLGMAALKRRWRLGDSLDAAEQLMVECAASGDTLDGVDTPAGQRSRAGVRPSVVVRAEVLCHLLTRADWVAHSTGVRQSNVDY